MSELTSGLRWKRALVRFFAYGALGLAGEIPFYSITRAGRLVPLASWLFKYDWRVDDRLALHRVWDVPLGALYGQASAWMLLAYGTILMALEAVRNAVVGRSLPVRGVSYMATILVMECATGWALRGLTGYDIWYYADGLALLRYTSLAIAPLWFILGASLEGICPLVQTVASVVVPAAATPGAPGSHGSISFAGTAASHDSRDS